jgi:hypothetical protein
MELVKTPATSLLLNNFLAKFLLDLQLVLKLYDRLIYMNIYLKLSSVYTLPNTLCALFA